MIATAGHVDHGKSTLIRALTGIEPDRWAQEQSRGMTIDLGYAWTELPGGETVTFVDVPGHQRFITNMLAGLGPVPAVLFVVAADDGWCRQSGEHLAALQALGVRHGLLAVTRADLYDADMAIQEAREYLKGTALEGIEAVAVSAITGQGLTELRAALGRLVDRMPVPAPTPATRLWVDRVFSIRGAGTVLTGTLSSAVPSPIRRRGTKARAEQLARLSGSADPADEVKRREMVSRPQLEAMGVLDPGAPAPAGARAVGNWLVHQDRWKNWLAELSAALDEWGGQHPLSPGMPRNTAVQRLGLPNQHILDFLLEDSPDVTSDAAGVHRAGVTATFTESVETALAGIAERLAAEPFAAPESAELGALGLTQHHLAAAVKAGRLTCVGKGVYLLPGGPEEAVRRVRGLPQPFTLSAARQALGTSRRVAVPLLEFLDRAGLTRRVETDLRVVR
ncbi:MAG: SelB C-terminal domain-containing protein [Trebonia sp.]